MCCENFHFSLLRFIILAISFSMVFYVFLIVCVYVKMLITQVDLLLVGVKRLFIGFEFGFLFLFRATEAVRFGDI